MDIRLLPTRRLAMVLVAQKHNNVSQNKNLISTLLNKTRSSGINEIKSWLEDKN